MRKLRSGAFFVALGILLSRVFGLARERVFASYFGNSMSADAFKAAFKIPNFLQNLFGEGVLSGSFIPAYASLLAQGDQKKAQDLAGAIASWLALAVSAISFLGIFFTPWLIEWIAPGFSGEKKELTIQLVKLFFPGMALLVMSAWCLGILNSHRRFFLSYAAPVAFNLTMIAALLFFGGTNFHLQELAQKDLALKAGEAMVFGSFLQVLVQLPLSLKLVGGLHLSLRVSPAVRGVFLAFGPMLIARGVVQLSAYIDNVLASYLPTGGVSSLSFAQTIAVLPVSLFGMSVAAASLPEMSAASSSHHKEQFKVDEAIAAPIRKQMLRGFNKISFFVIPSAVAFFAIGDQLVSLLFRTGAFGDRDVILVWAALAGSGVGLLAGTFGRLCASSFYALRDTKSPLIFALVRVSLTTALGIYAGLVLPAQLGLNPIFGVAGLTASAGVSAWVEFILLKGKLERRIGSIKLDGARISKLWGAAIIAGFLCWNLKKWNISSHALMSLLQISVFSAIYVILTALLSVSEISSILPKAFKKG